MKSILHLLFPRKCILCQKLLSWDESAVCFECEKEHQPRSPGKTKLRFIDNWYGLWNYQGKVRESIHRYKFAGRQNYAAYYAQLLAQQLDCDCWDVIMAIPISRRRRKSRGYDQGKLLAENLSKELQIPERPAIKKVRETSTQSTLHGEAARKANVLGAYQIPDVKAVAGKRVLLVDDVLTTGATACECARELKTAGAESITLVTVAAAARLK